MMTKCNSECRFSLLLLVLVFPTAIHAQSPKIKDAIAVCEQQRAPFLQVRERNREQTRGRAAVGALVGILGGVAAGSQVRDKDGDSSDAAMILGGLMGGVAGGYMGYLDAKKQIARDNRELVRMIDSDARGYASRVQGMIASIRSTGECRQGQITTWSQRLDATRREYNSREAARALALAAAVDQKQRRQIERDSKRAADADRKVMDQMTEERDLIEAAIRDDKKLQDDVLKYFDIDISGMAQAQAEVEGTSPASLRGAAESYVVEVKPPAILATLGTGGSSTTSAFGSSSSAFGGSSAAPAASPAPAVVAQTPPAAPSTRKRSGARSEPPPPPPNPWEAVVLKPNFSATNGHQAALVAQRNAQAESNAANQSALARLRMVYQSPTGIAR